MKLDFHPAQAGDSPDESRDLLVLLADKTYQVAEYINGRGFVATNLAPVMVMGSDFSDKVLLAAPVIGWAYLTDRNGDHYKHKYEFIGNC